jgi:hypothetical protein
VGQRGCANDLDFTTPPRGFGVFQGYIAVDILVLSTLQSPPVRLRSRPLARFTVPVEGDTTALAEVETNTHVTDTTLGTAVLGVNVMDDHFDASLVREEAKFRMLQSLVPQVGGGVAACNVRVATGTPAAHVFACPCAPQIVANNGAMPANGEVRWHMHVRIRPVGDIGAQLVVTKQIWDDSCAEFRTSLTYEIMLAVSGLC